MSRGAAVFGGQISLDEIPSDFRANGSSAHAKDVHVIVLDTLLRRKMIVNETGADAVHFVRANRRADAAAADRHAAIHLAGHDRLTERDNVIGIVVVGSAGAWFATSFAGMSRHMA